MKEKILFYKECFYKETIAGHIVSYLNGFCAVGILKKPKDHITPKANVVWIYGIGFNDCGNRIVENQNVYMTEDEARDLSQCLRIALKRQLILKKNGNS